MAEPIRLACEVCGATATVLTNKIQLSDGKQVETPKANVKPDGIYFTINCPKCGEREQCMARPNDKA
jgi:ribosomal protein S27E